MQTPPDHRCHVLATPWHGVYGTEADSALHYGRHWHATHGVGRVEHGAQRSASGRGSVDAYAGDLIATNPGEVHDGRPLGGPSRRWRMLYLEPEVIGSMAADPASPAAREVELASAVIQDGRSSLALQRLFTRLERWRQAPCAGSALACEESLARVCGLLLERHAAAPAACIPGSGGMAQVRDRLADELLEPPTLAALAAMAGLSRYQLLRRFETAYGVPPHAWLLQQRAEHARRLIRDGAPLAQAAASSGFADQSHLTRMFVRQFGFTPGAWRKANAAARLQ